MANTYFANVNIDLLNWLPLDALRVLELGCGEGALAAAYRQRNPIVHYVAVEIHEASAQVARARVDRLFVGDFEQMDEAEIAGEGPFDVVLMGDVLEHLADPWRTLQRIAGLLRDGGHLVCCVPNIAHWSAIAELFQGRWCYKDSGLFDRTHLRFFTLDSLIAMLKGAKFNLLKARPRRILLDTIAAKRAVPILADAAERLGLDRNAFIERASALQYVLVARKGAQEVPSVTQVHVAALSPRFLDVRARLPSQFLNASPRLSVTFAEKSLSLPDLPPDAPKVCVLQRLAVPKPAAWTDWVQNRVREGWVLVAEIDDHPELMAAVHNRTVQSTSWLALTGVHAVQTSTSALAEAFQAHNPEVVVFPNCVFTLPPFTKKVGPMRVFYGALNRERFSAQVAGALAPFLRKYSEVRFDVVHDRAFFEALDTSAKTFHAALPYDDYLNLMGGCHVAIMPLEGTFGETFKSDIKFLEASSRSVVTIASEIVYGRTIEPGITGLIAPTLEDWPDCLAQVVSDEGLRLQLARSAWEYVRTQRMFANQLVAREGWYRSLWQRRESLTKSLIGRLP